MTAVDETPAAPPEEKAPAAPDQKMDAVNKWAQDYLAKLTDKTNERLALMGNNENGPNGHV